MNYGQIKSDQDGKIMNAAALKHFYFCTRIQTYLRILWKLTFNRGETKIFFLFGGWDICMLRQKFLLACEHFFLQKSYQTRLFLLVIVSTDH